MAFNYVVTAQKPTVVTHSVTGNFTGANDLNLILGKSTRLEIHLMTAEGLTPLHDVPIYGRVALLELFRPAKSETDRLFLCTTSYDFCVLEYQSGSLVTTAKGNIQDAIGRCTEVCVRGSVDPQSKLIGLHLYEGYFKVIPITENMMLKEAFNIRLDELRVVDIKFLHGYTKPTICVLYEDYRANKHVKTYHISLKDREFTEGPWSQKNVENGACLLIPVPLPYRGVLILSQESIVYHNGAESLVIAMPNTTVITNYAQVDTDGSRYLLTDQLGILHVLALETKQAHKDSNIVMNREDTKRKNYHQGMMEVIGVNLEVLGETSTASCVSYLDNGVVFIGSCYGDSQLLKLLPHRSPQNNSYLEQLDNYTNIGPIVDFAVMDLDRQQQGQIVTCSGAYKDGSLRIIRSGIGIQEQAELEISGIKAMWSLRESFSNLYDKYLVLSFVDEIRILGLGASAEAETMLDDEEREGCDEEEGMIEMQECQLKGFVNEKTLYAGTLVSNNWIQVTRHEVRLIPIVDNASSEVTILYSSTLSNQSTICVASGSCSQLVIGTSSKELIYYEVDDNIMIEKNRITVSHDFSCIGLSSDFCCYGLWTELSLNLVTLPHLHLVGQTSLNDDVTTSYNAANSTQQKEVLATSILFAQFGNAQYLFAGLADGHLIHYTLKISEGRADFVSKKQLTLGNQPISSLCSFTSNSLATSQMPSNYCSKDQVINLFACCDRPTVIYSAPSNREKVLYANVNTRSPVGCMAPFNVDPQFSSFNENSNNMVLALAMEEGSLLLGVVDDIQKLHIKTVPLNEWPRRIAHDAFSKTLAVSSIKFVTEPNGEEVETSYIRLFDDQNLEILCSFKLDPFEMGCSVIVCTFDSTTYYYVVGTAYVLEEESEPHQGRILVFTVTNSKNLSLVTEKNTKGAVYCLQSFNGNKLLAGINSKTQLYKWTEKLTAASSSDAASSGTATASVLTKSSNNLECLEKELVSECGHHGHTLVLFMRCRGDFVLIGDLMKSLSLLVYKPVEGILEEVAKDLNSNWMSAIEILGVDDVDFFLGAEADFNLFCVSRNTDAASDEERSRLELAGEFHLGDFVNCFKHGSLVMQTGNNAVLSPKINEAGNKVQQEEMVKKKNESLPLLFGTVNGTVGAILSLEKDNYDFLNHMQTAMNSVVSGVGGFNHDEWRQYKSKRRIAKAKNFIDGDLIESFLDMKYSEMEQVTQALNSMLSPQRMIVESTNDTLKVPMDDSDKENKVFSIEELIRRIEELAHLH